MTAVNDRPHRFAARQHRTLETARRYASQIPLRPHWVFLSRETRGSFCNAETSHYIEHMSCTHVGDAEAIMRATNFVALRMRSWTRPRVIYFHLLTNSQGLKRPRVSNWNSIFILDLLNYFNVSEYNLFFGISALYFRGAQNDCNLLFYLTTKKFYCALKMVFNIQGAFSRLHPLVVGLALCVGLKHVAASEVFFCPTFYALCIAASAHQSSSKGFGCFIIINN